ncbi:MAG: 50S ribosomal protein L24 [Rhodospirillales bacterium]|jgi:large subunit ribosomal protein L24|nr:50S ribosomal protein L24 [Rhodospirillales bacterium]HIJ42778.1 50S ribosomal protein L24 [Rhodospirillaceae bacterium]MDP7099149.1 50S ribosomal protein L24 [Rhodospirillales bacterium]MDP7214514.1 50S ribosomal protein L24 [Rhodospirillales bacterium]HIJ45090.1 50S ribosomal protein L24 [Rhodospirillaceae bacterium]
MANKLKMKKGDKVTVTAGKDKGKTGEVLRIFPVRNRAIVLGVNKVMRHTKPTQGAEGGIIEKEASIHISNLAHIDPKTNQPTRVGCKILEDGRKVRFAKRSGEVIDN